jgi:hypothetical protein
MILNERGGIIDDMLVGSTQRRQPAESHGCFLWRGRL